MNIKNSEWVLMKLLQCGVSDIQMLDDIKYDLYDIVGYLEDFGILSLNNILYEVYKKGLLELYGEFEEQSYDISLDIEEKIKDAQPTEDDDPNVWNVEIMKEDPDYIELIEDLAFIKKSEENDFAIPEEDFDIYTNCQDSHIYIKHYGFFERYMYDEMCNIEDKMGISFQDMG